jgi:hypothetical protein
MTDCLITVYLHLNHGTHAHEDYQASSDNDWQWNQDTNADSDRYDEEVQKVPSSGCG